MAIGGAQYKARVLIELVYPNSGPTRYFCDANLDRVGCQVKDTAGTFRFWEPRAESVLLTADAGDLDGGMQRPQSNRISLLTNWKGDGIATDLLSDIITHRIEGASVTIWTRIASVSTDLEEDVDDYQRRFVGVVRQDGGCTVDVIKGSMALQLEEIDSPWTLKIGTTTLTGAGVPDGVKETLMPCVFGTAENGVTGIEVPAYATTALGTTTTVRFATIGSATVYDDPTEVRHNGTALTAQSPITDAPDASGKWGSWVDTTASLDVRLAADMTDSDVVIVRAKGIELSGSAPADADDVLQTLFSASGWTATIDATQMASWETDLTTALDELLGIFPEPGANEPAILARVLDDAMRRTCSIFRVGLDGKWSAVLPGQTGSTLHTVHALIAIRVQINPHGDYANDVSGISIDAKYNSSDTKRSISYNSVEYVSESTSTGLGIQRLDLTGGWRQDRVTSISDGRGDIRAQQQLVSIARVPLQQVDTMLIGDRVEYNIGDLDTTIDRSGNPGAFLGIGHVRTVRLNPAQGWAEVTAWHITWVG